MRAARFEIKDLLPIGFTIIVMGVGIAYGLEVLSETQQDLCDGSAENLVGSECWQCVNSSFTALAVDKGTVPQCNATNEAGTNNGSAFHAGSQAVNSTMDGQSGANTLTTKLPTIK